MSEEVLTQDASLQASNFSPSDYIRDRLKGVRTGDETRQLRALRSEMSALNSASQDLLKNNVFHNYQQFIDASKEISNLEREIYQLSSSLLDQKQLIENLMQMTGDDKASLHTVSSQSTGNTQTSSIQVLMQKMDGIAGILNNMRSSDRVILHGEVMLLDPETKEPIQKSMLILLTDRLLIGTMGGAGKYSLEATFALNSLAAVNVKNRESGASDFVFKLLVFPEQRNYRCDSLRMKKQWLDELENAKRELLHEGSLVRQATIRGKRTTIQDRRQRGRGGSLSPLADEAEEEPSENNEEELAWLQALPAELDVCLAHRDLDQAVEFILEWKQCRTKDSNVDAQLQLIENQIVQLLSDDVRRPGAVHGGPRAMKKARKLLTQLNRGTYATDLYLRRRSTLQRQASKEIAVSEEPLSYVRQMCTLFSTAATDVASEFHAQPQYFCQVLQWCSSELVVVLSSVRRHVIEVASSLAVIAHTWRILIQTMEELTSRGIQLTFEVHRLLGPSLESALEANFTSVLQGLQSRISEERWRPLVLESDSALTRLVEELSDLGLNVDWTIAGEGQPALNLSQHAIHFARQAHSIARYFEPLISSPVRAKCDAYHHLLWKTYMQHLSDGICDSAVFAYSTTFVLTQVLPLCEATLSGEEGTDDLWKLLTEKYPRLVPYAKDSDDDDDEAEFAEEEVAHV